MYTYKKRILTHTLTQTDRNTHTHTHPHTHTPTHTSKQIRVTQETLMDR